MKEGKGPICLLERIPIYGSKETPWVRASLEELADQSEIFRELWDFFRSLWLDEKAELIFLPSEARVCVKMLFVVSRLIHTSPDDLFAIGSLLRRLNIEFAPEHSPPRISFYYNGTLILEVETYYYEKISEPILRSLGIKK